MARVAGMRRTVYDGGLHLSEQGAEPKSETRHAFIGGDGIGGRACHTLLGRFGWTTTGTAETPKASSVPFLVINQATCRLIADIFGEIPADAIRTSQRLVTHHASDQVFASPEVHYTLRPQAIRGWRDWPVDAGMPAPAIETRHSEAAGWISSGNRSAWFCGAGTNWSEAKRSLIFEFVPGGWVFWAPTGPNTGFLQFVLPDPTGDESACMDLWRSTRLARKWVRPTEEWHARAIPCAAGARFPSADGKIIRCGAAAMRFDPIAGDGTGASLRSAILACAVLRYARDNPARREDVLRHYQGRLAGAYQSHLESCARYYGDAMLSPAWNAELAAIRGSAARAGEWLQAAPASRFRLDDLSLRP